MEDVTLRQFLTLNDVWGEILTLKPYPFLTEGKTEDLKLTTLLNYGGKYMYSAFEGVDIKSIARNIVLIYDEKWESMLKANIGDYDLLADNIDSVNESRNLDIDKTGTVKGVNKTSAFNSDELIIDSGNDSDTTEKNKQIATNNVTRKNTSLKVLFDNLSLVDKTNIILVVVKDVSDYLTVSTC